MASSRGSSASRATRPGRPRSTRRETRPDSPGSRPPRRSRPGSARPASSGWAADRWRPACSIRINSSARSMNSSMPPAGLPASRQRSLGARLDRSVPRRRGLREGCRTLQSPCAIWKRASARQGCRQVDPGQMTALAGARCRGTPPARPGAGPYIGPPVRAALVVAAVDGQPGRNAVHPAQDPLRIAVRLHPPGGLAEQGARQQRVDPAQRRRRRLRQHRRDGSRHARRRSAANDPGGRAADLVQRRSRSSAIELRQRGLERRIHAHGVAGERAAQLAVMVAENEQAASLVDAGRTSCAARRRCPARGRSGRRAGRGTGRSPPRPRRRAKSPCTSPTTRSAVPSGIKRPPYAPCSR